MEVHDCSSAYPNVLLLVMSGDLLDTERWHLGVSEDGEQAEVDGKMRETLATVLR